MKNILVTGGAGFIGSNFIRMIMSKEPGIFIVNLDALTYAGNLSNLADMVDTNRYSFKKGNICDRLLVDEILKNNQIDTIVHFAAESHVDRSIKGPMPFIETNVVGTATLLESARSFWMDEHSTSATQFRFHHISTDEVFGSLIPDQAPFTEMTPYDPHSPYAASKAASDHLVRAYFNTYHLPVTITNCSNNYGPYQFPEKLIPLIIQNARLGKPLPIYGDGGQIRDWLYVEDHCTAVLDVLQYGKVGETYNVGGNNQPTNLEIVKTICTILDELLPNSPHKPHSKLIEFVPDRPGHDRRYAMDISKINRELNWQPKVNLEAGLRKTIEWYLSNQNWVASIQNRPSFQSWIDQNYASRG